MQQRYVAIWFRRLCSDHLLRRQPDLRGEPFVLAAPERGRMLVKAASSEALQRGITPGMVVADCRAILPRLKVLDHDPAMAERLLRSLAEWCIRFTPVAAVDLPDGLLLDASGCAHLWGGEAAYLGDIAGRLQSFGYEVNLAMADTPGAAWAVCRFGREAAIVPPGAAHAALLPLPAAALRLDAPTTARLEKLGLYRIGDFCSMPRAALRRRFGPELLERLDQALGAAPEALKGVQPLSPYLVRLPCMDPIRTPKGIEIGLRRLVEELCLRFSEEETGARSAVFRGYRTDGTVQEITIGTNRPSRNAEHLFRLFDLKIPTLRPDLGFELFVLEATVVEPLTAVQDMLWNSAGTGDEQKVADLLDRMAARLGMQAIHRYLPDEHYWPERSLRLAASLQERPQSSWPVHRPRPVHLLPRPEPIQVTVPLPDYPPMLFHYRGQLLRVARADGPERIEPEWWLEDGEPRDYYCVEDENGARYWLFRLGHYSSGNPEWFIHGFFA